jgi:hypothetical protein
MVVGRFADAKALSDERGGVHSYDRSSFVRSGTHSSRASPQGKVIAPVGDLFRGALSLSDAPPRDLGAVPRQSSCEAAAEGCGR